LGDPDDAAVWRLDEDRALVVTTDFFTPVVDDAYTYGAIAAANSLSDVYAMGGQPFLALNIAALPPDLPPEIGGEILRGGAEKAREAGVVVAGGHTIQDEEPKYGLIVLGFVHPDQMLTKGGARPGDRLFLTKPLGFGVTTTALKRGLAAAPDVEEAIQWMARLNKTAGELAAAHRLRAATDITGFGLLGHAWEMAVASGVGLQIQFDSIPFLSGARTYAEAWTFPGGSSDNRLYFGDHVTFATGIDEASQMLLFDAQTSGGLLLAVPVDKVEAWRAAASQADLPHWMIGEVLSGTGIQVG
jgi:selenide,water dikinase